MKKITLFVIILIFSLFSFSGKSLLAPLSTASSQAATYFIDATGGNDANDGLTEQTAWQTLSKVNSYPFAPGENVLFKRGERWRGALKIPSSGTADMLIVFGAYGDGPLPIIDATALTAGWTVLGNNLYSLPWWIPDANTTRYFRPSVLVYGGEPMPPVYTLTFADLTVAPAPNNILLQKSFWKTMIVTSADINENTVSGLSIFDGWNTTNPVNALPLGVATIETNPAVAPPIDFTPKLSSLTEPGHWYWHDNTLYLYSEIPPDGMEVEVVSQLYAIDSNQKDYITIQDLAVRSGISASVILRTTDHAILRNLLIYDTGMLHWGAGITVWNANNNTISNNEIRSTLKHGILITAWFDVVTSGNTISGNYIHHTGGAGVVLGIAGTSDNIIEHNRIGYTNQLNFDGSGIHLGGSGTGNVIRYNRIFNGGSISVKSAGIMADINPAPTQFYYNLIYGNNNGGILLTGSGHEVFNNTLYHNNESIWNAGEIDFFPWGTGVSDCTVKNNIMVASDGKHFFLVNNWGYDSTKGHDIDYNIYMGNTEWRFIWGDQVTSDFENWKTLSSQDAHSLEISTIVLNNPPTDFDLTDNSPAIDAGIDVGLSYDFDGKSVPQNNFVDIGAYEFIIDDDTDTTTTTTTTSTTTTVPAITTTTTTLPPENFVFPGVDVETNPGNGVSLIFNEVTTGGTCSSITASTPKPPDDFRLVGQNFDISCTVTFNGVVTVCLGYDDVDINGNEADIQLMHRDAGGPWLDITIDRDAVNNTICGQIGSFSEFAIFEPVVAPVAGGGGGGGGGEGQN